MIAARLGPVTGIVGLVRSKLTADEFGVAAAVAKTGEAAPDETAPNGTALTTE
jgi:hypothetical protein